MLPLEIRLMVLQQLLVSSEPLSGKSTYSSPITAAFPQTVEKEEQLHDQGQSKMQVRGHKLYPTILRVCQDLLRDGLPLLYSNILELQFYLGDPARRNFDPTIGFSIRALDVDVPTKYDLEHTLLVFNKIESTLRRFNSYYVAIQANPPGYEECFQFRAWFASLGPIFSGKTVKVSIVSTTNKALMTKHASNLARAFQLARCKQFSVDGVPEAIASSVASVVTGDTPVLDLNKRMQTIEKLDKLLNFFCDDFLPNTNPTHHKYYFDAIDAVKEFDEAKFTRTRNAMMDQVRQDFEKVQTALLQDEEEAQS